MCCIGPHCLSRRTFIQRSTRGLAAGLLASPLTARLARASGATEALLLSCMDYRLLDEIDRYMTSRGLRNKYDHVILAGASLGVVTDEYPAWGETFWEHLDVSIKLHNIHRVIVLDHRDCGAYKLLLKEDLAGDRGKESLAHAKPMRELRRQIGEKHPHLAVELLLMRLDGGVEAIG